MKKTILKTALITFGITLILAVSVFGIVSFCAPASMMRFFESLGLENIGGDYAYQEYKNSQEIGYLAHAFEIAAEKENDVVAEERFEELFGEEGSDRRAAFEAYCDEQNEASLPQGIPLLDYRAYLCSRAAVVKYRLARTDDEKREVCGFAVGETDASFGEGSPVVVLALAAIDNGDDPFCTMLLEEIGAESKFDRENEHYINVVKFLEEAIHE